jgi:hypothetical protein
MEQLKNEVEVEGRCPVLNLLDAGIKVDTRISTFISKSRSPRWFHHDSPLPKAKKPILTLGFLILHLH